VGIKTLCRAQGEESFRWWQPEVILCCAFWGHLLQLLLGGALSTVGTAARLTRQGGSKERRKPAGF